MQTFKQLLEISLENIDKRANATHNSLSKYKFEATGEEKESLGTYQGTSYNINSSLWQKHHDNDAWMPFGIKQDIHSLDSLLAKNKLPHKIVVYSGTIHDPRKKKNKEGIMHHPAYISASLDETMAESFANKRDEDDKHTLAIHLPKGHYGTYLPSLSSNPDVEHGLNTEKEVLLPRGMNLRLKKTVQTGNYFRHHVVPV